MEYEGLPEIRSQKHLWSQLTELRQNRLMDEGEFLSFLKRRGIPAAGVIHGEPG
jgi:hypothetical protein